MRLPPPHLSRALRGARQQTHAYYSTFNTAAMPRIADAGDTMLDEDCTHQHGIACISNTWHCRCIEGTVVCVCHCDRALTNGICCITIILPQPPATKCAVP